MNNDSGISSLNKAFPGLRQDQLNEDSSRYDHVVAAPADEELLKSWYIWAALAFANGMFSFLVCLSIVMNKKLRERPFNLYLIYLMIPDFVFSLLCAMTCLLNAINGAYWSHWMCNFQQLYVVFGIGANAWLNAIIAHQLYMILRNSHSRRRYKLPTLKHVTIHAICVYLWSFFLGSWGIYEAENFPYHSGQASGLACLPLEGSDKASQIFFWACFFPLFAGIPIVYVCWISCDIYFRKLMPPPGQRRLFTIYFGRLILVFLVMWIPTLLIFFLLAPVLPQWVDFTAGAWSHLQGGVSAFFILLKPDIQDSFKKLITCHCSAEDENKEGSSTQLSGSMYVSNVRNSYWWPRRLSKNKIPALPDNNFNSPPSEGDVEQDMSDENTGSQIIQENGQSSVCSQSQSQSRIKAEFSREVCGTDDYIVPINDSIHSSINSSINSSIKDSINESIHD